MALEPQFLDFMPHTIQVYDHVGFNAYGEPAFSTSATSYQAMVEERPEVVRNSFGDEVISTHVVYVASTERFDLNARIVLPDGSEPPLIRATAFYDEDGDIHHVALFFGSGAGG